jgi:hypothetical protein
MDKVHEYARQTLDRGTAYLDRRKARRKANNTVATPESGGHVGTGRDGDLVAIRCPLGEIQAPKCRA